MKNWRKLALAAVGGICLLAPVGHEGSGAEARITLDQSQPRLDSLPFSMGRVLDYFNEAFGRRPSKIQDKSFVYTDRENPDEVVIVIVSDLEASLGVVLLATGDYGVNYVREFFEAPLFLRRESEQLYLLLDRGPGTRSVALERFNAELSVSIVGRWILVALELHPSQLYRPQLTLFTQGSEKRS